MISSEEFKKLLFKLITCGYKEVSTETSARCLLLWMKKGRKKVMQKLLSNSSFVFCCNKTQTFLVDNLYI